MDDNFASQGEKWTRKPADKSWLWPELGWKNNLLFSSFFFSRAALGISFYYAWLLSSSSGGSIQLVLQVFVTSSYLFPDEVNEYSLCLFQVFTTKTEPIQRRCEVLRGEKDKYQYGMYAPCVRWVPCFAWLSTYLYRHTDKTSHWINNNMQRMELHLKMTWVKQKNHGKEKYISQWRK